MKQLTILVILLLTSFCSFGQTEASEEAIQSNHQNNLTPGTYELFPTQNRWTFLKLNTRNGTMMQVQYDIEGDNRFETWLNSTPLVEKEMEVVSRFTLYPTQNIWTFILFDQIDGKSWQVQWSQEYENRNIWPISN